MPSSDRAWKTPKQGTRLLVIACLLASTTVADETQRTEQRLLADISYLAGDDLKGRGIGSAELDVAAEFIREEFAKAGLQTSVYDDGPYQFINLPGRVKIGDPAKNTLVFALTDGATDPTRRALVLNDEFRPLAIGGSNEVDLPLVFAGYGITAPEYNYDDYAGIDVEGKAVLMIRKEPQQADRDSVFDGRAHTQHAHFRSKIENAVAHGAATVIFVNDRHQVDKMTRSLKSKWNRRLSQLRSEQEKLKDVPVEDTAGFARHRERVLRLTNDLNDVDRRLDQADQIPAVDGAGTSAIANKVPVFFCLRETAHQLLEQSIGIGLRPLEDQLDELQPNSQDLSGVRVVARAQLEPLQAKNVLAILEGDGPLADETLIIGAHYDHVGMGGAGSLAPWTRAVHNGADDNASGVAALLEIARRLASQPEPPRRRIVFVAFTAEEIGLLGSQHYVREPRYPLSQTVAMLNLDMVGRLGDRAMTVQGLDTAEEFNAWFEEAAAKNKLEFKRKRGGNGPSDHASFYGHDIPVMHFFSGLHRDYHRPTDDIEKIDLAGMLQISNVVIDLAVKIANAEERPTFQGRRRKRNASQTKTKDAKDTQTEDAAPKDSTPEP